MQSESAEDVGAQYYDTESRLKTLRTKQDRLLMLMGKATKMEDIIALENSLSEVQYEIDQFASELSRYDSLIGYSTIEIKLSQVARLSVASTEVDSFGTRRGAAFHSGLLGTKDFLAALTLFAAYNIIPLCFILAVIAVIFFLRKKMKFSGKNPLKKKGGV